MILFSFSTFADASVYGRSDHFQALVETLYIVLRGYTIIQKGMDLEQTYQVTSRYPQGTVGN